MRLSLLATGAALLLCTTAAIAQTNAPNPSTAAPSANSADTSTNTATPLRDNIRGYVAEVRFLRHPDAAQFLHDPRQGSARQSCGHERQSGFRHRSFGTWNFGRERTGRSWREQRRQWRVGFSIRPGGSEREAKVELVGLDVYNASNQDIGQIKDLAVGPAGRTRAYIVSVGGFLGLGTHYVAMNPSDVKVSYNSSDQKWHATTDVTFRSAQIRPGVSVHRSLERE